MVSLNNAQHCDYGIQAMTTVMLDDGQSAAPSCPPTTQTAVETAEAEARKRR